MKVFHSANASTNLRTLILLMGLMMSSVSFSGSQFFPNRDAALAACIAFDRQDGRTNYFHCGSATKSHQSNEHHHLYTPFHGFFRGCHENNYVWEDGERVRQDEYRTHFGPNVMRSCGGDLVEQVTFYFSQESCPNGYTQAANGQCATTPPVNSGGNANNTCHPVNIPTGNKFFTQGDFTGTGSHPLRLTRYFNAKAMDKIWTFSYRQSLSITDTEIQAKREDGKRITFTVVDGNIVAPSQRWERLSLVDDTYRLALPGNTVEEYNTEGQLLAIQFPNGERHQVSYSDQSMVIHHNGETLTYTLSDNTVDSLVNSATLPDATVIHYTYDRAMVFDRLLTVTYPGDVSRTYLELKQGQALKKRINIQPC